MSEIQKVSLVQSKPGIRRDGTNLDGESYSDGKWVRFQRGRPKKMGGYSRSSSFLSGPVRDVQVWSRGQLNNVFTFSANHIEVTQINENGVGSSVKRLTPTGFVGNDKFLWSTDTMFDAAAGSEATIVLAVPTKTLSNIDDFTEYSLYFGLADGSADFEAVVDANAVASGGVFVTSPYAVLYGSDGKVTWSNANEPQNYTTGDAGSSRVTGSKIVQGHALRSGSGASGLLWALDSLIKMEYIGGNAIFRFSKVGSSSILAQNSVIEYDGVFYWIGIDRFMTSNGATVAEVPNDMNLNWFFDNLNYAQRQKIWAMKIPRFGEIWWFFPRGDAEECTHAIVLNLREQCWYDCELARSAGFYSQVFRYPIMFGSDTNRNRSMLLTIDSGSVVVGEVVSGGSSGATGVVVSIVSDTEVIVEMLSSTEFVVTEDLVTAPLVTPVDDHWDQVVLAMHLNGDLVDSTGRHTAASSGPFSSEADSPFAGGSCINFDGGNVTIPATADLLFAAGQAFTIEFFIKSTAPSSQYLLGFSGVTHFSLNLDVLKENWDGTTDTFGTLSSTEWKHIAFTNDGTRARHFINGVKVSDNLQIDFSSGSSSYPLNLADPVGFSTAFMGKMCELRITKGHARYTADLTPPTSPFLEG